MPYADPLGLVGQHLGRYVVRELSTAGGVALIYRGEHDALKSSVAIKVLRPELVEDAVRPTLEQMFLREAQILSQLRSDDILRALDHGRVVCPGDGAERPYIVVDWLEGHPLVEELERRAMDGRPYTLGEAIELLEPVARALSVCHEAGIVHRDVNPRNVFLEISGPDRPPRAKLIDFGFAKEVARTEALRLQRVDGTLLARSPDYAAPEHYDREAYGELSENTDIYTLALMLVEMLTLAPPLRGITDAELRAATTNRDDRPTPNRRGAHVSPEVEGLFAEALAIDQFERPGVLSDFWARLKAAANAAPPAEPPEPGAGSGAGSPSAGALESSKPPPAGARRTGRALVAFLVVATLGGVAAGAYRWFRRPLECPAGFADCNGARTDGCETDLRRDAANCGACGTACGPGASCEDRACRAASCAPHLGDCNHEPSDGCETDLATDQKNCGACGASCSENGAKQVRCVASRCESTCRAGFGDCDRSPSNGCETALSSDASNCGRCGAACGSTPCEDGLCVPTVLANAVSAGVLAVDHGVAYFRGARGDEVERAAPDGTHGSVVSNVAGVTALAVGGGRVVWVSADHGVFARPLDDAKATPRRIAGPLASDTPLVVASDGTVSWSNRAERSSAGGARDRAAPPAALRRIFSVSLEALGEKEKPRTFECNVWPRTFTADREGTYCCDAGKPLSRVECSHGRCTSESFDALCPDELQMDRDRLYFAQDVRVLSLDRKSGKLKALSKRRRHPRSLALDAGFLYWIEGEHPAEVWRVAADADGNAAPELVARRKTPLTSLAAEASTVYFVGDAPQGKGSALYELPLSSR
ncbi:MAG TPA: protein kinase [Polyangiaceae bacterium]|nr:protein kinase [Polyangiaceae bacterium]